MLLNGLKLILEVCVVWQYCSPCMWDLTAVAVGRAERCPRVCWGVFDGGSGGLCKITLHVLPCVCNG